MIDTYQEEEGSTFSSNGRNYDLNYILKHNTYTKEIKLIDVSKVDWFLEFDKEVDLQRTQAADLSFPILLTHEDGRLLAVDGAHRIRKAKMQGIKQLPYRMIDPDVLRKSEIKPSQESITTSKQPAFSLWK